MRFGVWEILLIIVLVLVLFGGSKLAGVGKNLGRGIKEFKEEVKDPGDSSPKTVEASVEETEKNEAKNSETDA